MKAYFRDLLRMSTSLVTITYVTKKIQFYYAVKMTIFMSKPIGKDYVFISKTSKITRKHNQFYFSVSISHILCD